jgi:hypothetical protein
MVRGGVPGSMASSSGSLPMGSGACSHPCRSPQRGGHYQCQNEKSAHNPDASRVKNRAS